MKTLTTEDFQRAADRLKCEVASIRAVDEVESRGRGFYSDGFPVILFERHIFRKYTRGRYTNSHPHLSGPAGNYGAAGANQRRKFNEAFALNPDAAMMSCSWGRYQIMGFNHKVCGYATVGEFVDAMKESEGKQLDAFVTFVIKNRLDKHLRNKDWASFAEGYNGAGYRKNKYDSKMAKAYLKYSGEEIAPPTTSPEPPQSETSTTSSPDTTVVEREPTPKGFWDGIKMKFTTFWVAVGGTEGAKQFASDAQFLGLTADTWRLLTYIALGLGALLFIGYGIKWLWSQYIGPRLLTAALVQANKTNTNVVTVAESDRIAELEALGYTVARRK